MNRIIISEYKSPVGVIKIGSFDDTICLCDWKFRRMRKAIDDRIATYISGSYIHGNSEANDLLIKQLDEYFQKKRTSFEIPMVLCGTEFQQKIWKQLFEIEYGTWISYRQLAEYSGDLKSVRAVASANGNNALAIIVPCHRVLSSDGKLTGYAGGLTVKKKLLALENAKQKNLQLHLF